MLTDIKAKNARAKAAPYKLADRDGLYLYVSVTGAKSWRFDFRHAGKRQTLTYGQYPQIPLADQTGKNPNNARSLHAEARKVLAKGDNPALQKKRKKFQLLAAGDFRSIAEAWYEEKVSPRSASWKRNARRWLDLSYPYIGSVAAKDIGAAELLAMLKDLAKKKKPYTAEAVRKTLALVFDYAIQNLKANNNPARSLRRVIEKPKAKSHPHIPAKGLPAFLKALDKSEADIRTKLATRLLMFCFCRKNELLQAKWPEVDIQAEQWEIPGSRMKNGEPHLVPLSPQAVECFRKLEAIRDGDYIFPKKSDREYPMAAATLNMLFKRIGYDGKLTPHGLRSTASTALNEAGFRADVIERQLSHVERNDVRRAYNKSQYLAERKELMEFWANMIDSLCAGGKVIPFRRGQAA